MSASGPGDEELLARIEDAALNASAPPQQLWLDGWLIRLCPGKAKRARSINAVAPGRRPLADKLREAEALYRAAGLPLIVRVTPFTQPPGFDAELAQRGFASFDATEVLMRELGPDGGPSLGEPRAWTLQAVSVDAFCEIVGGWRGTPPGHRAGHARRVQASPVPYRGYVALEGDQAVACAQFTVEGEFMGLYDVFTAPEARGRGIASWLCAQLLALAAQHGARTAYLQVDAGNAAALTVYRRLGFRPAYRYHYRSRDPDAA